MGAIKGIYVCMLSKVLIILLVVMIGFIMELYTDITMTIKNYYT